MLASSATIAWMACCLPIWQAGSWQTGGLAGLPPNRLCVTLPTLLLQCLQDDQQLPPDNSNLTWCALLPALTADLSGCGARGACGGRRRDRRSCQRLHACVARRLAHLGKQLMPRQQPRGRGCHGFWSLGSVYSIWGHSSARGVGWVISGLGQRCPEHSGAGRGLLFWLGLLDLRHLAVS